MQKRVLLLSSLILGSSVATFVACSSSPSGTSTSPDGGEEDSGAVSEDSGIITVTDSGTVTTDSGTESKTDSGTGTKDSGSATDSGSAVDSGSAADSGLDATLPPADSGADSGSDAGIDAGADAGPGYITLNFDPTGTGSPDAIYWDNAKQILYIVDDTNNQVWTYTDTAGFVKFAQVPDNPALDDGGDTKLNGITELADGTLVITRFGYGKGGAIYTLNQDGGTTTVPNVPVANRRIEVTSDPTSGTIYSDSFVKVGSSPPAGEVETVDLTTGTTVYATGFGKTVGLLVQGAAVLVADQTNNVILAVPTDAAEIADGGAGLTDGGLFPVYASVSGPDQLSVGPNGSIYTDQFQSSYDGGGPQVRQIWPDGGVTVPWPNAQFTSLSDVAYDSSGSRLFVVDNNGTTVRTIKIFTVAP